ncbi:MAG: hypothetical protein Q9201_004205 [Fulgogasparrea decipioides]
MHPIVFLGVLSNGAAAAALAFPPSLTQGFRGGKIVYSAGKQAICANGVVSVPASATNTILNLSSPTTQFNATEIFQELLQAGSTLLQRAQGGTRTVQGTYGIAGNLCVPADSAKAGAVKTVEILTHGVGLEKSYWDIAPGYSYVDAAAVAGYATFAYDRLGVGQSDHPDPIQDVQAFLEVEILHGLAQLFRTKTIGGYGFTKIVGVGHSFGSIVQVGVNSKYPKDFDGVVLTGFTNTLANLPYTILANSPSIAALNQPSRFGKLPNGYLVHNDEIAIQEVFFRYPYFDPASMYIVAQGSPQQRQIELIQPQSFKTKLTEKTPTPSVKNSPSGVY